MPDVTNRTFLLIQGGVIASDRDPYCLIRKAGSSYDIFAGFKIFIGCVNEFGVREIVGIVAEVLPLKGCKTWRITSKIDGYNRLVGPTGAPAELVASRLGGAMGRGDFDDLANLPAPVRIVPGDAPVPYSRTD